ncbi:tyrosine-type recombinase/integrase [Ferrovum myxofaciens]|nr:site-specific integrase [Ferrovum myxofaciens]
MSLYKDSRCPYWYISVVVNGRRLRRSTGTADKTIAKRIHDETKAGMWQEAAKPICYSWQDAFLDWVKAMPRGKPDRYRLRAFKLPRNTDANSLTAAMVIQYLPSNPATYNRMVSLILAILNHAKATGKINQVPVLKKKKVTDNRIRWLTSNEWERLEKELPSHLRAMAGFAVSTGLRKSNVTGLEWSQVDLNRKVAWIHPDQAKAGKPIMVPLSEKALAVLSGQIGQHPDRVFTYNGKPVSGIKTAWTKALSRAGLTDFRWHDLRHTWATWHIQSGTPLAVLQKLGGWSDFKMVLRYAHFAPDYLAGYADNCKPYSDIPAGKMSESKNLPEGVSDGLSEGMSESL